MSKLIEIKEAEHWFEKQLSIHAAVLLREKHFPDLKVNEMLTGEQIRLIYMAEAGDKYIQANRGLGLYDHSNTDDNGYEDY